MQTHDDTATMRSIRSMQMPVRAAIIYGGVGEWRSIQMCEQLTLAHCDVERLEMALADSHPHVATV